jgi:hypothetical protein
MQYAKEVLTIILRYKDISSYSNSMEPTKEVISNLKFIGQLQKGDKINTKFMYRQPDGITTRIYRTLINYDNRQNALMFVQRTIDNAFDVISNYLGSEKMTNKTLCINVVKDLKQARIGLLHLQDTYSEDLKFRCDMETLLEGIDAKLDELESRFPVIFHIPIVRTPSQSPVFSSQGQSPTLSEELGQLNE